jgi:hypothetical protein
MLEVFKYEEENLGGGETYTVSAEFARLEKRGRSCLWSLRRAAQSAKRIGHRR